MSDGGIGGRACYANRHDGGTAAPLRAADWLSLAAAPAFAVMTLLTVFHGGGQAELLCATAHGGSPVSGMTLMYVLMSVFHSAPWLKLSRRKLQKQETTYRRLGDGRQRE